MVSPFKVVRRISMLLKLELNVDSTVVSALTNIALPCFSWGHSITRVIPGIRGQFWLGPRWVSWIHRMSQSCSLQMLARRSSFVDDNPSMFADNASNAGLGKGLSNERLGDWPVTNEWLVAFLETSLGQSRQEAQIRLSIPIYITQRILN